MDKKKVALRKQIAVIVIFLILIAFPIKILLQPKVFKQSKILMGTIVNITIIDKDLDKAKKACKLAFEEMHRIEKMLSNKDKSSEIYKLNQCKDLKFTKTNPEIIFLLKEAEKISNLSQGAFDVTVGPLVELWNKKLDKDGVPTYAEIYEISPLVDYRNIEIDSQNDMVKFKKKGVKIDLGAIAKGYAVDQTIKMLKQNGVKNCLVEAGGDLFVLGKGKDKSGWHIGVKHPRESGLILEFKSTNRGIATSGDYERFKILNKKRYHHLIDPRTGFPVNQIISVTITAPNSMIADALATAVFILGIEKGIRLIKMMKDIQGIIVIRKENNFEIFSSQSLKNSIITKIYQKFF